MVIPAMYTFFLAMQNYIDYRMNFEKYGPLSRGGNSITDHGQIVVNSARSREAIPTTTWSIKEKKDW